MLPSSRALRAGPARPSRATIGLAFLLAAGLGGAGCSSLTVSEPVGPSLGCVDDSPRCVEQRRTALAAIMGDSQRRWIREPASAQAYASGVRLFAFKQQKRNLTCDDLAIGRREAEAAPPVLRGPSGQGLTPGQISRSLMLAEEVASELKREQGRRCRA